MFYKVLIIIMLFFLSNCGPANNAFLGPSMTAVKTGSITQTGVSYTSANALNKMKSQILINHKLKVGSNNPHQS
tara:strand:- start:435 stop:656 length:222 start_codon:yes stop_codon:yes gene_type:complete